MDINEQNPHLNAIITGSKHSLNLHRRIASKDLHVHKSQKVFVNIHRHTFGQASIPFRGVCV